MKTTIKIMQIFFVLLLLAAVGCEAPEVGPKRSETPSKAPTDCNEAFAYASYVPVKVEIMPLTEYTASDSSEEEPKIEVYMSLSDSFGSQIKSPGTFRFELYEKVPRSAEPKGKRIILWPDIDLTDIAENENHWRDFLRAYEFSLPIESKTNQNCILQVTCICPNGKRLSAEFPLKQTE
jgi:hypothetical protein